MKSSYLLLVLLASSTALLNGCVLSEEENPFDAEDFDVGLETAGYGGFDPPFGSNGYGPPCFWDSGSQQALRDLGKVALTSGASGKLPALPTLLASCREVLKNAVECALNPSQSVDDPVNGLTYQGHWGLADEWYYGGLSTDGKRWVTACMVQRLNVLGAHVDILLEGNHPRIVENLANDATYDFEESSAYGNLFDSRATIVPGRPAFSAYVCSELEQIQQCPASGGLPWIDHRICDQAGNSCGLVYLGACQTACIPNGPAGEYWSCKPSGAIVYNPHTIRVQLKDPTSCF
ncbi:hypothetical protein [Polyangium sorediatum]|uniref:Lipoprotein n=1 Tax=Polyangium sorediatum TaxID=889274 RepID=A0ABT6NXE6_9BACT|nr:hypothetical protein [Polyangium sorediatum]MDI1433020.1 hypothetical protein [Polyangium sorediatum]